MSLYSGSSMEKNVFIEMLTCMFISDKCWGCYMYAVKLIKKKYYVFGMQSMHPACNPVCLRKHCKEMNLFNHFSEEMHMSFHWNVTNKVWNIQDSLFGFRKGSKCLLAISV